MPVANQFVGTPDTGRGRNGVALPMIKVPHPASRIEDPKTINVRGVSRQSDTRCSMIGEDLHQYSSNVMRPITADQIPFSNVKSPRHNSLPPLGEEKDVKLVLDKDKPSIPIFGSAADVNGNRTSRPSTSSTLETGRISTNELEKLLREKMVTGYFTMKNAFKHFDPEGKGIVNRESLSRIISNFLAVPINLSQFNKLMTRLHLEQKKMISFPEFYVCFKSAQNDSGEYPTWFEMQRKSKETMTAVQVILQLKEKAKQRFLNMASLIPQMNPGGTKRILKPEFRNALNNLGFYMEDEEFDKLWSKFDTENIGAIGGDKILSKLGINIADSPRPVSDRSNIRSRRSTSPTSPEFSERDHFDVDRWMSDKFREGARDLMHAFFEVDLEKKGNVNKTQFKRVLSDYNIQLDDSQINNLLERCDLPNNGPIDYKAFIKKYQDRSEIGMANKILNDPSHKYNQNNKQDENTLDASTAESRLMDLFQTEFLSLLGSFHKIDRDNTMLLSEKQFRAVIESKFKFEISDEAFKILMKNVPVNEDGKVKYVEFMTKFDSREAKSLFDAKSTISVPRDMKDFEDEPRVMSPKDEKPAVSRAASRDSYDSQSGRSIEEISSLIKAALKKHYQEMEKAFQELDEFNSRKLTPEMTMKLLKRFDVHLSKHEIKRMWNTFITDHRGCLEYMQFVRHFAYSLKSAAFPNAKLSPPKRGDSDFQVRSKKLNSAYDMIEDSLRSNIDRNWEQIHARFHELDPNKSGFVSKDQFKKVLQNLCIHLTDYECEVLSKKFDVLEDGRVSWIEFLKPFTSRRQVYRKGNNMSNLLTHPRNGEFTEAPESSKGFPTVAVMLKKKFSGDVKQLQRAFKKLDTKNDGLVTVQEFNLVLKLCDISLNDEELYQLLSDVDKEKDDIEDEMIDRNYLE